jgi:hypothetical protein
MSYDEITAIVRRRYDTGDYGHAHFTVPRPVLDEMRATVPTPPAGSYPAPRLPGYSIGDLMGIPVLPAFLTDAAGMRGWTAVSDADRYRAACAQIALSVRAVQAIAGDAKRWRKHRGDLMANAHADLLDAHRRLGELLGGTP